MYESTLKMIIKFQGYPNQDIKSIRWLFKDYYRVIDEKLFLLEVINHEIVFVKIEGDEYEAMLYNDLIGKGAKDEHSIH